MRNALTFLVIAAGMVVLAVLYPGARWLLLWTGGNFAVVAAAYRWHAPQVFGKRGGWDDGLGAAPAVAAVSAADLAGLVRPDTVFARGGL